MLYVLATATLILGASLLLSIAFSNVCLLLCVAAACFWIAVIEFLEQGENFFQVSIQYIHMILHCKVLSKWFQLYM